MEQVKLIVTVYGELEFPAKSTLIGIFGISDNQDFHAKKRLYIFPFK